MYEDPSDLTDLDNEGLNKFLVEKGYSLPKIKFKKGNPEGKYTSGNSFRAKAEKHSREYRSNILGLTTFDKWGHKLKRKDYLKGLNLIPSYRAEILQGVYKRKAGGKGINLSRTLGNLLSSQAMCFNLFTPLSLNKDLFANVLKPFFNDLKSFNDDIQIEYTPRKEIFQDQSEYGGVDCDALFTYNTYDGKKILVTVETKYVEREFSICGFRKSKKGDKCPYDIILQTGGDNCYYKNKKKYLYWERTIENELFYVDKIFNSPCPFGGSLWQLWTNVNLAATVMREKSADDFRFIVICPKANTELTQDGEVFNTFRSLLTDQSKFIVIYLEDLILELRRHCNHNWVDEFDTKYSVK